MLNYKYLTHDDFLRNGAGDKNQRDTNNERISNFQNLKYSQIENQNNFQNNYLDERDMFNKKNKEDNFKQDHNNRMSQLGNLPSSSAFPINNQKFNEIKSINTRNIKE